MNPNAIERRKKQQAGPGYEWIVVSHEPRGVTVTCKAPNEPGAYQIAEAKHPGVRWAYVTRRECACHNRLDCCRGYDVCAACERPAQRLDMGTLPGSSGARVCVFCYRFSQGRTFDELRAFVADARGPGMTALNPAIGASEER